MKTILLCISIIATQLSYAQNPYAGKWVMYDIKSFKDRDTISEDEKNKFQSTIIFNEDITFTKKTNGSVTSGKYEYTSNKFIFLEKNVQGKYYVSWSLRWPKNTLDPLPQTPEIDLCYPELFTVNGRPTELDVYYVKEGE